MKTKKQLILSLFVYILLIFFLALFGCKISNKQANIDSKLSSKLDKLIDENYAEKVGGYGFVLFDKNGIIWTSSGGHANDEKKIKFSKDTVIRIGEISQQFVFYTILKLFEKNKINLKDSIFYYLQELENTESERLKKVGELSIESIIKNASGYVSNFPASFKDYDFHKDLLNYLKNVNQIYSPNIKFTESLPIIDLLGLLIEKITKKDFSYYMEKEIFNPLKLKSSTYYSERKFKNESLFYSKIPLTDGSSGFSNDSDYNNKEIKVISPSYSMRSSLEDLAKFYSILLNEGNNGKFLSKDLIDLSFTPIYEDQLDSEGFETGLGWHLTDINLNYLGKVAYKVGTFLSHKVLVILLPDKDVGIVCAINRYNWGINENLYPTAINILKSYMDLKYNIKKEEFVKPVQKPIPQELKSKIEGLYACQQGVFLVKLDNNTIDLYNNGGYAKFVYYGENKFLPEDYNQYKKMEYYEPDKLVLRLNTNAKITAEKIDVKVNLSFKKYNLIISEGIYKSTDIYAYPSSFLIKKMGKFFLIESDDSKEYLIIPVSNNEAKVLCTASSIFYNKKIFLYKDKILIDSNEYKLKK
ncbi:MAG: beta-lactamase family protein [Exilispira sp.]|jgi:CubicO group peptidase (beta-lactamase class C family)|nr:beta-lactamase family protein [Exilispira sp.]